MYDKITYADAVKWRKEWMDARAAYIQDKIDNDLYTASLVKQGPGTLVMTGDNTYEGLTTVEGGKLSINGTHASSIDVHGGNLGGSGIVEGSIDVVLRCAATRIHSGRSRGCGAPSPKSSSPLATS
jgi:subtilase-type serine protease